MKKQKRNVLTDFNMKPITIKVIDDNLRRRMRWHKLLKERGKIDDKILASSDIYLIDRLKLELKDIEDDLHKITLSYLRDVRNNRQSYLRAGADGLNKAIEQRIKTLLKDVDDINYLSIEDEIKYANDLIKKGENQLLNKYFRQMIMEGLKEKKIPNHILKIDIDKVIIKNDSKFREIIHQKEKKYFQKFLNRNKTIGTPRASWIIRMLEILEVEGFRKGETIEKKDRVDIWNKLKKENYKNQDGNEITLDLFERKLRDNGFSDPDKNKTRDIDTEQTRYAEPKTSKIPDY